MAQKQFKIGLSNTDKQNMAQDVYERLLALTFPEYNTTTEYEVGDFVVYNDQLYKCIGATSGAWDSTKWQLATLNDLVDDIENAVAFVNDKANVDGNYPTMTVGVADQLSPYDKNSGDDQDEPFSFQATGTGNGTQPDFATGSIALMKEKQGNTVVVNQLLGSLNASNFGASNGSVSFNDGVATFTANTQYGFLGTNLKTIVGHTYLVFASIKLTTGTTGVKLRFYDGSAQNIGSSKSTTDWQLIYGKRLVATANVNNTIRISDERASDFDAIQIKDIIAIDLTQWFNGDIPQDILDNPSNFFRYYQGSLAYNEGTLVNANGRYIKCIGMNQWDEEWELGYIDNNTGENVSGDVTIRSKNYTRVLPNTTYYIKVSNGTNLYAYDNNKNFIGMFGTFVNQTFTTPQNCCYIRFRVGTGYGTTYNNDISINLYYEDEERCLTYEPYEVLTNNDTGTETLRSAGSVKDSKSPDGTIHRLVGSVDLSTLTWSYQSQYKFFFADLSGIKNPADVNTKANINCKYPVATANSVNSYEDKDNVAWVLTGSIRIRDLSLTGGATPTGTLFYELAEPTTEQGTPFSENLVIDDFGSMDFGGTNGVPQGCLIFYPVDYKAFVDTLYKYTDGTPSNLAKKSDLPTAPQTWAESLPGYDATKTQTLKNIEGTLTWVDDE